MTNSDYKVTVMDNKDDEQIIIPVDHGSIAPFISRLLGQQQSIEREMYGTFSVDHSWFLHINELIDQRIRQQNKAVLVDFTASIYFENDLKRTLTTLESFKHYSETKKVKSQSVKLIWTYLISFPNSKNPEKQEVSLYVSSKAPITSNKEDPVRRLISSKNRVGNISYKISHTERTWGDDIETLLKDELSLLIEEESKLKLACDVILLLIIIVLMLSALIVPDYMNSVIQQNKIDTIFSHYDDIIAINGSNFESLGSKADLILRAINPKNDIKNIPIVHQVLMILFASIMSVWCLKIITKTKESFVLLTKESHNKYDKYIQKFKNGNILSISTFLIGIVSGVAANYLFYYLNK